VAAHTPLTGTAETPQTAASQTPVTTATETPQTATGSGTGVGAGGEEATFRGLLESAPDAMVITDATGAITLLNAQAERLFGYARDELIGRSLDLLVPERFEAGHRHRRAGHTGFSRMRTMGTLDLSARHKDGSEFPVEISLSPLETERGLLISTAIRDITDRKAVEAELRRLADHDALTGLPNRRFFEERLGSEVARAGRYGATGTVLLVDVDSLKGVNDSLGHARGDELLRTVGGLIERRMRKTDVVARIGGDEFAVILPHTSVRAAQDVADTLLSSIRRHAIAAGAHRMRLSVSIGIASFGGASLGGGEPTGEDVMVAADYALYEAKDAGRGRVVTYQSESAEVAARHPRVAWSRRLRTALDTRRLVAHRQPIMSVATRTSSHFELLVRMLDDDGNPILPGVFLPSAERTGMVRELDRFMISQALGLIAPSRDDSVAAVYEVNLSARSLADPDLGAMISRQIAESGADASRLTFEITENAAIANLEQAARLGHTLRELGCGFTLDDFGSGFASFSCLEPIPFNCLKIDGDLILDIADNPVNRLVVRHIAEIARELGLATVAESVEDPETLEILAAYGIDRVQGHFIGRPAPISDRVASAVAPG
jgi:diguanylate cyclase (GGDEF)-like protein/PAS domain S-box-containing protein